MRVLILSPIAPSRGILRSLARAGIEPIVARPGGENTTDDGVQFVRVAARGNPADPVDLRWSRKGLRALVRELRPALIHIVGDPTTPTAEAGAAAARRLGIPYVILGSATSGGPRGLAARWQASRVTEGAAGLAGASRPALAHLAGGETAKPTAVIPQTSFTIPPVLPARSDPPPVLLAFAGRLSPERGVALLLESLGETYGDWRLRVVGTGPSQEELESSSQRLGLGSRIEWLGPVPRELLPQFWSEVDAVVAPSITTGDWVEPTGSLILEAMAHGVAPIVSRCGALPDVVGEAGLVIDEGDKAALVRALQAVVHEAGRARRIGMAARERVTTYFSDTAIAHRMADWWTRVVATAPESVASTSS